MQGYLLDTLYRFLRANRVVSGRYLHAKQLVTWCAKARLSLVSKLING